MRRWLTSCDPGYLPRLKVLVASMRRHCASFRLHVLAHGADVVRWAAAQPDMETTPTALFLARHPDYAPGALPGPRRERMDEVLCTYRWRHLVDVLERTGEPVTAIDADLMFWSSPEPVFEEIAGAPMAVLPHNFPREAAGLPGCTWESSRKYGLYNGGWVYFAEIDRAEWMAAAVREWCYAGFRTWPDGRQTYGDQGTLEVVAERFGAHVIQHTGAAPGPWCIHNAPLAPAPDGGLLFGDATLVSYHYQSMRPGRQLADPHYKITVRQAELLYAAYSAALAEVA